MFCLSPSDTAETRSKLSNRPTVVNEVESKMSSQRSWLVTTKRPALVRQSPQSISGARLVTDTRSLARLTMSSIVQGLKLFTPFYSISIFQKYFVGENC